MLQAGAGQLLIHLFSKLRQLHCAYQFTGSGLPVKFARKNPVALRRAGPGTAVAALSHRQLIQALRFKMQRQGEIAAPLGAARTTRSLLLRCAHGLPHPTADRQGRRDKLLLLLAQTPQLDPLLSQLRGHGQPGGFHQIAHALRYFMACQPAPGRDSHREQQDAQTAFRQTGIHKGLTPVQKTLAHILARTGPSLGHQTLDPQLLQ